MKFLIVDTGLSEAIALRLADEGNKVFYYSVWEHADPYEGDTLYGRGLLDDHPKIERVQNWHSYVDKVDLILFNDISFGEDVSNLLKSGYKVIGTTKEGERLEADRWFPHEKFQHLRYPPMAKFKSVDKAVKHIKEKYDTNERVVVKLSGFVRGTYVSFGKDDAIDYILQHASKAEGEDVEILVQKFIDGVEVAVGAWVSRHFPLLNFGWNMNFEHKKKFPGDLGPNCYSEDTEVLTKDGWKLFKDVTYEDEILAYNKEKNKLVWEKPLKIYWKYYEGKLIHFKNRYIDLLVTPNHRMLGIPRKVFYKRGLDGLKVVSAEDLAKSGEFTVLQASTYGGYSPEYFELPAYRDGRGYTYKSVKIDFSVWVKFMGWYLSEGYVTKHCVYICQHKNTYDEQISAILKKMPFSFTRVKEGFKIYSTQLANYLKQFGKAKEKYIPSYIKNASSKHIRIFLEEFRKGDGSLHNSQNRYHSSSYRLISDIQEMLLKIGIASTIVSDKRKEMISPLSGKVYSCDTVYSLEERRTYYTSIRGNNKETVQYSGYIGSVTVPSSFIVVRRNGRVAISGNTGEMGTMLFWADVFDNDKLVRETLMPMSTWLRNHYGNHYVDINLLVEYNTGKVYVVEFTCFDEETEILTKEGWKDYKSVKVGDLALSIDPQTKEISWKRITNKIVLDYEGDMVRIGGDKQAVDIFVTPDHELIYEPYFKKEVLKSRADEIPSHCKIIRSGYWKGEEREYIEIPDYVEHHYLGKYGKYIDLSKPVKKVKAEVFMKFLGLYLAEGSIGSGKRSVVISQSPKSKRRDEIRQILEEFSTSLNCKLTENEKGFQISSIQLVNYLGKLGLVGKKSYEKFIPQEFKELSPKLLRDLLYGFYLGDGSYHRNQYIYATSSERLADDLQEIVIKIGKVANIYERKQKGTIMTIDGKKYTRNSNLYVVSERSKKINYYVDNRNKNIVTYKGKVWDVEVEDNHTLLVRRKGKPYFSGNCRFGYPHILITLPLILSDIGSLFWSMASGEATEVKYDTRPAVGIGINIAGYPNDCAMEPYFNMKFKINYPKEKELHKYYVPAGVYKQKGDKPNEFRVVPSHGRVFVAVGVGETLLESQLMAVDLAERVLLPDGIWRYDIGDRLYAEVPYLLKYGYISTQRAKQFMNILND